MIFSPRRRRRRLAVFALMMTASLTVCPRPTGAMRLFPAVADDTIEARPVHSSTPVPAASAAKSKVDSPRPCRITDRIPYGQAPISYDGGDTDDAVARLARRMETGGETLAWKKRGGYLPAILKALRISTDSQLLVFSKSAVHPQRTSPRNPRAIYFNDEVSVGWVPGTDSLELSAIDPRRGAIFYTLEQKASGSPRIQRADRCLTCHAGSSTLEVPGWMLRSAITDDRGQMIESLPLITHDVPLERRFGGWYVTGTHGTQPHRGNVIGPRDRERLKVDPLFFGNRRQLPDRFDPNLHLLPHSDLVAHLVLTHQSHGLNLLTRVHQEFLTGRKSDAEDRLLRYLVFADEAPLAGPMLGTSGFRETFAKSGKSDGAGRSLREFDLKTRLFRYRLSYLVHTSAFEKLPSSVRRRLYERLFKILHHTEQPAAITAISPNRPWPRYSAEERDAIVSILRATQRDLPSEWLASRPH